jgi:hypothetical protein
MASSKGHKEIIGLFLSHPDININIQDEARH